MSEETTLKITLYFSLLLSVLSALFAFISGADILVIFFERLLITFLISAFLTWMTLKIINSVIIKAALTNYVSEKTVTQKKKGGNLDFTSEASPDVFNETREEKKLEPLNPIKLDKSTENVINRKP